MNPLTREEFDQLKALFEAQHEQLASEVRRIKEQRTAVCDAIDCLIDRNLPITAQNIQIMLDHSCEERCSSDREREHLWQK